MSFSGFTPFKIKKERNAGFYIVGIILGIAAAFLFIELIKGVVWVIPFIKKYFLYAIGGILGLLLMIKIIKRKKSSDPKKER